MNDNFKKNRLITVLVLDLEGTLIGSSLQPVPRPGLFQFLEWCKVHFVRLIIYTCVNEPRFREIAGNLVVNGLVPAWFKDLEHIECDGMVKDLSTIGGIIPEQAIIVDDYKGFIPDNQKSQYIEIKTFDFPYEDDDELQRVMEEISRRLA